MHTVLPFTNIGVNLVEGYSGGTLDQKVGHLINMYIQMYMSGGNYCMHVGSVSHTKISGGKVGHGSKGKEGTVRPKE